MPWTVLFHEEFDLEFLALDDDLKDELLAHANLLQDSVRSLAGPL